MTKKTDRPTVIDGVVIPPGVRHRNSTQTLVRDPKTGKASFKLTRVGVPTTVTAGRTTINHIADGPYTPKETAEINAIRLREGLPVIETRQGFIHTVKTGLGEQTSELAKSLGAGANKAGAARKAGQAYEAEQNEKRRVDDLRVRTNVSVVDARGQSTVNVPVGVRGPKMDRS